MRIAVISDIHANIEALKAVLADVEREGIDRVYCTGDLVGYAPFPNEVIDLIRNKQISTVMGNYDDAVGNMRFICGCDYKDEKSQAHGEASIVWTKENTSEENKEFLRSLPHEIRLDVNGKKVLLVHGSPGTLNEYIFKETPAGKMLEYLEQGRTEILICGHTHIPYHAVLGDKHIINAGSVGKPKHGDSRATYVIVNIDEKVSVQIKMVEYNFDDTARAIEESSLPSEFAELIRRGIG